MIQTDISTYARREPRAPVSTPSIVIVDPRLYRRRVGRFLLRERLLIATRWTPLVRVRAIRARASEGGTEA